MKKTEPKTEYTQCARRDLDQCRKFLHRSHF